MQHWLNYNSANEKLIKVLLRLFARNYADCDSTQLQPDLVLKIIEGGFVQASQVAWWWWWWWYSAGVQSFPNWYCLFNALADQMFVVYYLQQSRHRANFFLLLYEKYIEACWRQAANWEKENYFCLQIILILSARESAAVGGTGLCFPVSLGKKC